MKRKGGTNKEAREESGCPQEERLQESKMQFGSSAAGPTMGAWGRPGAGPGPTPAQSALRGREGKEAWERGAG